LIIYQTKKKSHAETLLKESNQELGKQKHPDGKNTRILERKD